MGPQILLGVVLDSGGESLARWLGVLAIVTVGGLVLIMSGPLVVLASLGGNNVVAGGTTTARASPAPSIPSAPDQPAKPVPQTVGRTPAVDVARHYLGVPYVFGGSNPALGLDCSGLVQLVYRQLGVGLPRTAQTQFDATPRVGQSQLEPGDLVFFARTYADPHDWITHVGIYIGDGMQINAPTEGQVVSIQPVFSGYWGAHFAGGGRVAARQ